MRIGGVGAAAIGLGSRRPATRRHEPQATPTETRALVTVAPTGHTERSFARSRHPAAPFLAQLIATQIQAPQTRARRRAEPEDAVAVYQGQAMDWRRQTGRSLSRDA